VTSAAANHEPGFQPGDLSGIGRNSNAVQSKVDRRHETETRREEGPAPDPSDRHDAILQRLAKRLEHRARELGKLVQQEDTAVRQSSRMSPERGGMGLGLTC
jgi:hypothetical protein